MADKFVSVIRQDGEPGPLYGPYDYNEAEQVLLAVLQSNRTQNGPVEITDEVKQAIELDGSYSFDGGGGVYIVESEDFTPGDEDEAVVDLSNNGSMEFDRTDGTIRYHDSDGNCQDKWEPGDESYDKYKADYFPTLEVDEEIDEEIDE